MMTTTEFRRGFPNASMLFMKTMEDLLVALLSASMLLMMNPAEF